ncbi:sodium/glucose cotransporter 1-like [Talpa occidentalis]|uniref:sodium/glucose cotransporter 1-like n=1 Tax=Talpa occidentalis TaxID=50954 RepID=UPI00188F9CEB|nr:sodium/glucose cotransporter 1-like [Talpa occidentalis]
MDFPKYSNPWNLTVGYNVTNSVLDVLLTVFYFMLVLGTGMLAILTNSRGTIDDFFLAGRNLAWWSVGASFFATHFTTVNIMNLAGNGASSGFAIGATEWNISFMLFILGWVFSPFYMKAGVATMPEYMSMRFGSRRIQCLLAVLFLFVCIFHNILVELFIGTMAISLVWGMDVNLIIIILLIITGIYAITGGFTAVVFIDAIYTGILLLGSILLMAFAFEDVGGYEELQDKYIVSRPQNISEGNWTANSKCYIPRVDSYHIFRDSITGDIPWPGLLFGVSILNLYRWCASQIAVQRCLAGKGIYHVKLGCIFCGYLTLLPMFIFVMPGMISRILYPDKVACVIPSHCEKQCGSTSGCSFIAYPLLAVELLPTGILGVMLSALWASLISSLTSNFNCASTLFTLDLYTQIRPTASEKELMVTGRFFVIVLFAITIAWATLMQSMYSEEMFEFVMGTTNYLAAPIAAVFLLAIFSRRVTEQGAFWGLVGGVLIGLCGMVLKFIYKPQGCMENKSMCPVFICNLNYLYFVIILFIVTIFIIVGISSFTLPVPDKHLHQLCWTLRNSQEERVYLEAEIQRKTCISQETPETFRKDQGYFWIAWDVFCGLKLYHNLVKTKPGDTSGSTRHDDIVETSLMKKTTNAAAIILLLFLVLCHIYYF